MELISNTRQQEVSTKNNTVVERQACQFETDDATNMQKTERESRNDEPEEDTRTNLCASDGSSSSQALALTARQKDLEAQAAAEISAVQEFKVAVSDEDLDTEARRRELAAEVAVEIKRESDIKRAALERLLDEDKGCSDESVAETQNDGYISVDEEFAVAGGVHLTTDATDEKASLTRSTSKEEENAGHCIRNTCVESMHDTTDEEGNDVSSHAKEEQNNDCGKNDVVCNVTDKDWISKLYEEEETSDNSAAGRRALETEIEEYISDDEEDALVKGAQFVTEATTEVVGLTEFSSKGDESIGSLEGNDDVERVQGTGGNTETNMEKLNTAVENVKDDAVKYMGGTAETAFRKRPRLDQSRAMSVRSMDIDMSMSNCSIGPAHISSFVKGDLLDFDNEEMSFEDDDDDDDRNKKSQRGNEKAEIDREEKSDVSMSPPKEGQNNDYGQLDTPIRTDKDRSKTTAPTSSSNTTDERVSKVSAESDRMKLSDLQMLQSIKMAIEADKRGVTEFHTSQHLDELETVPILSLEKPKKPFRLRRKLKEKPRPGEEKLQFGSRMGGMMRRASSIFSFRKKRRGTDSVRSA